MATLMLFMHNFGLSHDAVVAWSTASASVVTLVAVASAIAVAGSARWSKCVFRARAQRGFVGMDECDELAVMAQL